MKTYVGDAKRLGMTDEDQRAVEQVLLDRPDAGDVMIGTGGLRKLRFAPQARAGGKSGGVRICYAHFPVHSLVVFVMVFAKNEQANLPAGQRAMMRQLLRDIESALNRRN